MPTDFDCSMESCSSSSPQTYSCQSISQLFGPSKKPSSVTMFHMMTFRIATLPLRPPRCFNLRQLTRPARLGFVSSPPPSRPAPRLPQAPQLCFRQLVNEPVQHFGPALLNPRALKNRLGDGMMQGNLCRAAMLGERQRHQRFCRVAWAHAIVRRLDRGAFLIRKGIEVDDSLRLHDLAIDASAPIVLALGRSHAVMKNTTGRRSTLQNGVVKPFGPDQRIRR